MGAQTGGAQNAAFKLDTQNRAIQGAARRRDAISRRNRGPGSPRRPGIMEPGRGKPVRDPSREQLDAMKNQFNADDQKGIKKGGPGGIKRPGDPGLRPPYKPGEGADVGIGGGPGPVPPRFPGGGEVGIPRFADGSTGWERKEGAHILKEGQDAEMRGQGIRFGPGQASRSENIDIRSKESTRPGIQFGMERMGLDTGPKDVQGFKDFLLKLEQFKNTGGIK